MKKSMLFICLLCASFLQSVYAKDAVITTATVQDENRTLKLVLELDDRTSDIEAFRLDEFKKGLLVDSDVYAVDGDAMFTLYRTQGRDVIKLISKNFSNHQGGEVILNYLQNGITKRRDDLVLDLSRHGDRWVLSKGREVVKSLYFVKNIKMIIGLIGIKTIEVN